MSLTIELNSVLLTGPTLASVFQAIALSQMEFDGLLLGRVGSRVVSRMVDLTDAHVSNVHEAFVSGFCSSSNVKTFYDAHGVVDNGSLADLAGRVGDPTLGWYVYRNSVALEPSERELAVSRGLLQALAGKQEGQQGVPVLFALFSASREHHKATTSFRSRFFQTAVDADGRCRLSPVGMRIKNLGRAEQAASAARGYDQLTALSAIPLMSMNLAQVSGRSHASKPTTSSRSQDTVTGTIQDQNHHIRSLFEDTAAALQQAAAEVCEEAQQLIDLQRNVAALEACLADIGLDVPR